MKLPLKNNLQKLDNWDRLLVLFRLLRLHSRRPALPAPLHFSIIASLCMFVLLAIMPFHPLAIPIVIGGGISMSIVLKGIGEIKQKARFQAD